MPVKWVVFFLTGVVAATVLAVPAKIGDALLSGGFGLFAGFVVGCFIFAAIFDRLRLAVRLSYSTGSK